MMTTPDKHVLMRAGNHRYAMRAVTIDKRKSPSGGRAAKRRPAEGDSCRRADAGFTFVEVVVTIVLVGVVVLPILAAVRASIRTATVSESAAEVETLLVNAVDRVNRAPRTGTFQCDLTSPVEAAVETHGWPASSATVKNHYLNTSDLDPGTKGTFVEGPGNTACPATGFYNGIVQRFTITITNPDDGLSRTLQVVKGDI